MGVKIEIGHTDGVKSEPKRGTGKHGRPRPVAERLGELRLRALKRLEKSDPDRFMEIILGGEDYKPTPPKSEMERMRETLELIDTLRARADGDDWTSQIGRVAAGVLAGMAEMRQAQQSPPGPQVHVLPPAQQPVTTVMVAGPAQSPSPNGTLTITASTSPPDLWEPEPPAEGSIQSRMAIAILSGKSPEQAAAVIASLPGDALQALVARIRDCPREGLRDLLLALATEYPDYHGLLRWCVTRERWFGATVECLRARETPAVSEKDDVGV